MYLCFQEEHCINRVKISDVTFQKGQGFANPMDHLIACYKPKSELFEEVRHRLMLFTERTSSQVAFHITYSKREEAKFAYMQLIVLRNEPITIVSDELYRGFSRFYGRFSRSCFTQVLLSQVVAVDDLIGTLSKERDDGDSVFFECMLQDK